MVKISPSAMAHFNKLIEQEQVPELGILLSAINPGTSQGDARLEFVEPEDLVGDEWAMDCDGFTLYIPAENLGWLEGAEIDYVYQGANTQLIIRAPKIKGEIPPVTSALDQRVQWVVESEINPQLAQHGGYATVESVTPEGVVTLRFNGGCQGCGMASATLSQGIEKTLMSRVPEVTEVRDVTDHARGESPYIRQEEH